MIPLGQAAWAQAQPGAGRVAHDEASRRANPGRGGGSGPSRSKVRFTPRSVSALPDTVINTGGTVRARALIARNGVLMLDGAGVATWGTRSLVLRGRFDPHAVRASEMSGRSLVFRGRLDLASAPPSLIWSVQERASSLVRPAVYEVFGTDSVARQIEYGFAGTVGPLPPFPHQVQKTGVAVPPCFAGSREGGPCN